MVSLKKIQFEVTEKEIEAYTKLSGDDNPVHLDHEYATSHGFSGKIAHGMLTMAKAWGSIANEFENMQFPKELNLTFQSPVYAGEEVELTIMEKEHGIKINSKVVKGEASI